MQNPIQWGDSEWVERVRTEQPPSTNTYRCRATYLLPHLTNKKKKRGGIFFVHQLLHPRRMCVMNGTLSSLGRQKRIKSNLITDSHEYIQELVTAI
jgi:hypothetical protein